MERIILKSSLISGVGYDENTRIMEIKFVEGGMVKKYRNVDKRTFEHLISCTSVGLFYLTYIDGFYEEMTEVV